MIICKANNKEDIEFARKNGVWQTSRFAKETGVGELFALQLTKTKDPIVVGRITSEVYETAPFAWPSGVCKFTKTVSCDTKTPIFLNAFGSCFYCFGRAAYAQQ